MVGLVAELKSSEVNISRKMPHGLGLLYPLRRAERRGHSKLDFSSCGPDILQRALIIHKLRICLQLGSKNYSHCS